MAKTELQKAKEKATDLHSLLIRAEGRCRECGYECPCDTAPVRHKQGCRLQCAHIHSRSYAAIRCDLTNGVPLCASCHQRYTLRPDEWHAWCDINLGPDEWWRLYRLAHEGTKVDWFAVLAELTVIAAERGVIERGAA